MSTRYVGSKKTKNIETSRAHIPSKRFSPATSTTINMEGSILYIHESKIVKIVTTDTDCALHISLYSYSSEVKYGLICESFSANVPVSFTCVLHIASVVATSSSGIPEHICVVLDDESHCISICKIDVDTKAILCLGTLQLSSPLSREDCDIIYLDGPQILIWNRQYKELIHFTVMQTSCLMQIYSDVVCDGSKDGNVKMIHAFLPSGNNDTRPSCIFAFSNSSDAGPAWICYNCDNKAWLPSICASAECICVCDGLSVDVTHYLKYVTVDKTLQLSTPTVMLGYNDPPRIEYRQGISAITTSVSNTPVCIVLVYVDDTEGVMCALLQGGDVVVIDKGGKGTIIKIYNDVAYISKGDIIGNGREQLIMVLKDEKEVVVTDILNLMTSPMLKSRNSGEEQSQIGKKRKRSKSKKGSKSAGGQRECHLEAISHSLQTKIKSNTHRLDMLKQIVSAGH